MRGSPCGLACGPAWNHERYHCGLEEGHRGVCMPRDPALRHGLGCAHAFNPVGRPPLSADLCICDPHGDKARARERSVERYRRREVLWQDEVWYQRDGSPVRVKDMGLDHMQNTVAMLERHAEGLKFSYELQLSFAPGVQGEHALDAVDQILRETLETDAVEWLHDTPLVRRLDRRIRKRRKRALREDFGVGP